MSEEAKVSRYRPIPFNEEKAREWNSRWEQRYARGYIVRDDGKAFPKPRVKPTPVNQEPGERPNEPHSASVIRELERHINGKVLSP